MFKDPGFKQDRDDPGLYYRNADESIITMHVVWIEVPRHQNRGGNRNERASHIEISWDGRKMGRASCSCRNKWIRQDVGH